MIGLDFGGNSCRNCRRARSITASHGGVNEPARGRRGAVSNPDGPVLGGRDPQRCAMIAPLLLSSEGFWLGEMG